jgi:isopentenyl-diphosphate delta-isomerase
VPSSHVVHVDAQDAVLGTEEKLRAHTSGILHRAVSVFAFDTAGALVVQRRALSKYHSGGLWSNSACTHPQSHETPLAAAERCVREELGVDATLRPAFRFCYRVAVPPNLIEHEFDHVFVGTLEREPTPRPEEVAEWRAVAPNELAREMKERPGEFTAWFLLALPLYERWCESSRSGCGESAAEGLEPPFFEII